MTRLRASKIGCYIGNTCMSVLSYADDIILLSPTKRSMYILLNVCDNIQAIIMLNLIVRKVNSLYIAISINLTTVLILMVSRVHLYRVIYI